MFMLLGPSIAETRGPLELCGLYVPSHRAVYLSPQTVLLAPNAYLCRQLLGTRRCNRLGLLPWGLGLDWLLGIGVGSRVALRPRVPTARRAASHPDCHIGAQVWRRTDDIRSSGLWTKLPMPADISVKTVQCVREIKISRIHVGQEKITRQLG